MEILLNNTRSSIFMTGKAGTGKSTFLRHITATTKKKFVVLAPTGIAAVNAGGQTIHSFFHIPLKPLLDDDVEFDRRNLSKRMKYTARFIKLLRELDLIIIDEISMVRADIIDFIDKLLRHFCPKFAHLPFGGKQMLMVGDVFQLEPVAGSAEREILRREYSNLYFFSAKVFRDFHLVPIELRKVYRQNDTAFVELLDRVRDGQPLATDLVAINSRVVAPGKELSSDGEMVMTIATRRDIVAHINETHLEALKTKARRYTAEVSGEFPATSFPTDRDLEMKEGAQVVFIRNDAERRWVNGTLGKIVEMYEDKIIVELDDATRHEVEPEVWDNIEYSYNEEKRTVEETVKGSFRQFPVKLAWALTIHKSQGLTFKRINIDVGTGAFAGGQSYVALSRCTSLEGITLASPFHPRDIYVSQPVRNFARLFNDSSLIFDALEDARYDQMYLDALKAFNKGHYTTAVDLFAEASAQRKPKLGQNVRKLLATKLYAIDSPRRENERLKGELARKQSQLNSLAEEFVQMGLDCLNEGWDYAPALANFNKALSLNPANYEAMLGKGRSLLNMGEREEAVEILSKATRDMNRFEAPFELGNLYLSEGDISNALLYLEKTRKLAPANPAIYEALADACEAADEPVQAARYRKIAAELRAKGKSSKL